jgi:hypothetical protein
MLINCPNWLSEIICPTIAVESTGAVGSWFCNSCERRLRKVDPIPPSAVLFEDDPPVLVVPVAFGRAIVAFT